jgi:hypothetical protein
LPGCGRSIAPFRQKPIGEIFSWNPPTIAVDGVFTKIGPKLQAKFSKRVVRHLPPEMEYTLFLMSGDAKGVSKMGKQTAGLNSDRGRPKVAALERLRL